MYRYLTLCILMFVLAVPFVSAQTVLYDQPLWVKGYGAIWFATPTPDHSRIVMGTTTGLYLVDPSQPDTLPQRLEGHKDTVQSVSFSADGSLMASSSLDGTVRLWTLPNGAAVWSATISEPYSPNAMPPVRAQFSEDGSLLLVSTGAHFPGPLFAINAQSGAYQPVESAFFPAAARLYNNQVLSLIKGSDENTVQLVSLRADLNGFVSTTEAKLEGINTGSEGFATLLEQFVIMQAGDELIAYSLEEGTRQTIPASLSSASTYKDTLFTYDDTRLSAFNIRQGSSVTLDIKRVETVDDAGWVLYTAADDTLSVLNLNTLDSTPIGPTTLNLRMNKGYVLLQEGETLRLFDPASSEIHTLNGAIAGLENQALHLFVENGTALVIYNEMSSSTAAGLWDVATGEALVPPRTFNYVDTNNMVQDETHQVFIASADEVGLLVSDLSTPSLTFFPTENPVFPKAIWDQSAFYTDGQKRFALFDLTNGETTSLGFDSQRVIDLAFSPDSTLLATAEPNTVRLWDVATGELQATFSLTSDPLSLVFSELGVVVLTNMNTVQVFRLPSSDAAPAEAVLRASPPYTDIALYGRTIAVAGDHDIHVFRLEDDGTLTFERSLEVQSALNASYPFGAIAVGEQYIALARNDRKAEGAESLTVIDLWERSSGRYIRQVEALINTHAYDLNFSPDDTQMALTMSGITVVWNTQSLREPLYTTSSGFDSGSAFAGAALVTVEQSFLSHKLDVWEAFTGAYRGTLRRRVSTTGGGGGDGYQVQVAGSPDGQYAAMIDPNGELVMWSLPDANAPLRDAVFAYCDQFDTPAPVLPTDQPITIEWSWFATEIPLMFDHLYASTYEITLDGAPLSTWDAWHSIVYRDRSNDNHWTVYYRVDAGVLAPGEHTVTYHLGWNREISDGLASYGPGSAFPETSGTCTFTVEAEE